MPTFADLQPASAPTEGFGLSEVEIGVIDFFVSAVKDAPYRNRQIGSGIFPLRIKVIKLAMASVNSSDIASLRPVVISFRCCGRRPSGPPAEPLGNLMMALRISYPVTGVA